MESNAVTVTVGEITDSDVTYLTVENVNELTSKITINDRIQEKRVIDWIGGQSDINPEQYVDLNNLERETSSSKRKYFDEEAITSDEDSTDELHKTKRKKPKIYLDCEWVGCRFNTTDYPIFQDHVKSHLPDVIIKAYNNGSNAYVCLWDLCDFETSNEKSIKTHVNYHAYHTKIKAFGKIVLNNDGECFKDSSMRNKIPLLPEEFNCLWKNCSLTFTVIQDFFDHVKCHGLGERKNMGQVMSCYWMGCPIKQTNPYTFMRHILTHTLHRLIGCPNCGMTYSNRTAMIVHLQRQSKKLQYKCGMCPRYFASKHLLKQHALDHKRNFKCKDCNTTFSRKSSLISHIRSIHLNMKTFQCNLCSHRFTNKSEIRDHLERHEKKGRKWIGSVEGRLYVCHYCEKSYSRSTNLTKHLIKTHGYKPVKHPNRFKYVITDEGVYRLLQFVYGDEERKHHTEVSLKSILKDDEDSQNDNKYKLVECIKSEPNYTLVQPSDDKSSKSKQKHEDYENPLSKKIIKKKCRICKNYFEMDSTGFFNHKCSQDIILPRAGSTEPTVVIKKEIVDSEMLQCETSRPIEISIEEIDLQGNVVKIEVVEELTTG